MFAFLERHVGHIIAPAMSVEAQMLDAVQRGDLERFEQLLKEGANVNARNASGSNALHVAAAYNRLHFLDRLTELGLSVHDVGRDGNTPLHFAAMNEHSIAVERLIGERPARAPLAAVQRGH